MRICLFCVIGLLNSALAQPTYSSKDSCAEKTNKLLPIAFFTPETRIGVGGLFYKVFESKHCDSASQKSILQTYLTVTQNRQYALENDWRVFAKRQKYMFSGRLDYTRFPEFFFGIGNNTSHSMKELYSFDLIKLSTKNQKKIDKNWYLGISNELQYLFSVERKNNGMMEDTKVKGTNGYFINGLGLTLTFDARNNVLNTTNGSFLEISGNSFHSVLGSEFRFSRFTFDARKYYTFRKMTFAGQAYLQSNEGIVPFRALPVLGGVSNLRGFYSGRFRDNNMTLLQAEIRMPLFWRIGLAAFTGMGQVASTLNEFKTNEFKYNTGIGFRYLINQKDNVNIRFDLGFTNEGYGLYIVFAEAF